MLQTLWQYCMDNMINNYAWQLAALFDTKAPLLLGLHGMESTFAKLGQTMHLGLCTSGMHAANLS